MRYLGNRCVLPIAVLAMTAVIAQTTARAATPAPGSETCFQFENERLEDLVIKINRYNTRQLSIVDPNIKTLRLGGSICPTRLATFVRALRRLGVTAVDADSESSSASVILLAAARK